MAIFLDHFTGPDGTQLTAHAPDAGSAWSVTGGDAEYVIQGNKLSRGSSIYNYGFVDVGTADMSVSATFSSLEAESGLVARFIDAGNYWGMIWDLTGWRLVQVRGANQEVHGEVPGTTGTVSLRVEGNT